MTGPGLVAVLRRDSGLKEVARCIARRCRKTIAKNRLAWQLLKTALARYSM